MKETLEQYLEAVYQLSKKSPLVKSIEVSHLLDVNRPDVFRALKTLKMCGYIDQQPYGRILLTPKGKSKAEQCLAIHQLVADYFTDTVGLSREDATANAYKVVHVLSDTAINKLIALYHKP